MRTELTKGRSRVWDFALFCALAFIATILFVNIKDAKGGGPDMHSERGGPDLVSHWPLDRGEPVHIEPCAVIGNGDTIYRWTGVHSGRTGVAVGVADLRVQLRPVAYAAAESCADHYAGCLKDCPSPPLTPTCANECLAGLIECYATEHEMPPQLLPGFIPWWWWMRGGGIPPIG